MNSKKTAAIKPAEQDISQKINGAWQLFTEFPDHQLAAFKKRDDGELVIIPASNKTEARRYAEGMTRHGGVAYIGHLTFTPFAKIKARTS